MTEELQPIPVSDDVLIGLPDRLGYDEGARYIAIWWTPLGGEVMVSDGFVSFDGSWRAFMKFDQRAGKSLLQTVPELGEKFDEADVPDYQLLLTRMLRQGDRSYNIGTSDTVGNAALLYDRGTADLYVSSREHVMSFIERFNDPPEWVEHLPDDPEVLMELFERAIEETEDELRDFFENTDE